MCAGQQNLELTRNSKLKKKKFQTHSESLKRFTIISIFGGTFSMRVSRGRTPRNREGTLSLFFFQFSDFFGIF